jgi:hypothetical protein
MNRYFNGQSKTANTDFVGTKYWHVPAILGGGFGAAPKDYIKELVYGIDRDLA